VFSRTAGESGETPSRYDEKPEEVVFYSLEERAGTWQASWN